MAREMFMSSDITHVRNRAACGWEQSNRQDGMQTNCTQKRALSYVWVKGFVNCDGQQM